jgi:hypothetical protein
MTPCLAKGYARNRREDVDTVWRAAELNNTIWCNQVVHLDAEVAKAKAHEHAKNASSVLALALMKKSMSPVNSLPRRNVRPAQCSHDERSPLAPRTSLAHLRGSEPARYHCVHSLPLRVATARGS